MMTKYLSLSLQEYRQDQPQARERRELSKLPHEGRPHDNHQLPRDGGDQAQAAGTRQVQRRPQAR